MRLLYSIASGMSAFLILMLGAHCFPSLVLGNLAAWSQAACVVYPSEIFDPKAVVQTVLDEKCTALHGVPTHFLGVLSEVERREKLGEKLDFKNLRYFSRTLSLHHIQSCHSGLALLPVHRSPSSL
jgi:acyl-CoA synthetase (AMP-forming)/AMP-acid ligase II